MCESWVKVHTNESDNKDGGNLMSQRDVVFKMLEENNGLLTARQAWENGVGYKNLQRMNQSGEIEKIEQGLYMDPEFIEDKFFLPQYRCQKWIFSHETALYFHNLADRTPFQLMVTIPSGYNTRLLKDKEKYKFFYSWRSSLNGRYFHGNSLWQSSQGLR